MTLLSNLPGPLWLWCMMFALVLWGVRVLIDEYLTKVSDDESSEDAIYKESIYGTVISGRFALYAAVPFLLIYFIKIRGEVSIEDMICLLVAGGLYLLHLHYFFILMSASEGVDASWTESAGSANLVLTPIILYVLIKESFSVIILSGVVLVAVSVGVLFFRTREIVKHNVGTIFCFVATFSGSSILSDYAYEGYNSLWIILGLLGFFYAGMGLCGRAFYLSISDQGLRNDINLTVKSNLAFLSFSELIDLSATFFFQVAIAVTPSVILVLAMLEFMPVAIMALAVILLCVTWRKHIRNIAKSQFQEGVAKVFASVFTFIGAILIIGAGPIERVFPDIERWASEITTSTKRMVHSVQKQEELTGSLTGEQYTSMNASDQLDMAIQRDKKLKRQENIASLYPSSASQNSRVINKELHSDNRDLRCMNNPIECIDEKDLLDQPHCQDIYTQLNTSIQSRLAFAGEEYAENDLFNYATGTELESAHAKCRVVLREENNTKEPIIKTSIYNFEELCPDQGRNYNTLLTRKHVEDVQLWLSAYAQQNPGVGISMPVAAIDGLYGKRTCRAITVFESAEKFPNITGTLDESFYMALMGYDIDVSKQRLELAKVHQSVPVRRQQELPPKTNNSTGIGSFVNSQWERIKFCLRSENRNTKFCESSEMRSVNDNR